MATKGSFTEPKYVHSSYGKLDHASAMLRPSYRETACRMPLREALRYQRASAHAVSAAATSTPTVYQQAFILLATTRSKARWLAKRLSCECTIFHCNPSAPSPACSVNLPTP